ncbi:uncharacterized protein Z519_00835 [Cladophialophora bantiana CBS 173.52]|uniref:Uncharacterized protein n=1 Tax=Cladophialophora bantiana (strain ATCC 10958 / CBS 173.52 / CDC B-1940 / NIH 8579) TaxID=1442370 RepID=A0A0D2GLA7_CLAB1|nr:uncharacterized protein Z519_00835 [Cladophialophora bantiana CBS 173.52]KIW99172.1 hypothetical protein Z519_00835 [Cladophialophora bantiana CBS 173.52]
MDPRKEQEAGRQRMRDLFEQREIDRGSLRRKRIFKTPEEEAKQAKLRLTPNAQARTQRELTATRGPAPLFNENIWSGERRGPSHREIRSVSPRTRVDEEEERAIGNDKGDVKKSSVSDGQARRSGSSYNGKMNSNKSHHSGPADKKKSS